jgi:hypothetical protein
MDLAEAVQQFDLEGYVRQTFDPIVESGSEELRVNCFAPRGCDGDDTKQHLWVNVRKKAWLCYKCGYGDHRQQAGTGWLVRFLADAERLPVGVVIHRLLKTVRPTPAAELEKLLEDQFAPSSAQPINSPITFPASFKPCSQIPYLADRGFREEWLEQYDVRHCLNRSLGLWNQRVIFPIRDLPGKLVSAVGRVTVDRKPRWQNWPGSDIQSLIWPLHSLESGRLIPFAGQGRAVLVVEGAFDVLGTKVAGMPALATLGKKLSTQQVALLQRLGIGEVILAWDFDARDKMRQAVDRLVGRFPKVSVFPFLGACWRDHDLGDMMADPRLVDQFQEEIEKRVQVDSDEFLNWTLEVQIE